MIRPNKKVGFILPMPGERAFTLAELMIATGITAIIVVMLGTMLGSLLNTASRANQRIDAFREARAALQMIDRVAANEVCLCQRYRFDGLGTIKRIDVPQHFLCELGAVDRGAEPHERIALRSPFGTKVGECLWTFN